MSIIKNVLLNSHHSMQKKIRDIQMIFDVSRKLPRKVKFWSNFGTFDTSPLFQFSKFNNFL